MSEYYEFDSTVYVIIRPKNDNFGEDHDIDIDCRFLLHEAEKKCPNFEHRSGDFPSWACKYDEFGGAGRCHNPNVRAEVIAEVMDRLKKELNKQEEEKK